MPHLQKTLRGTAGAFFFAETDAAYIRAWQIETVDSDGNVGGDTSLALYASGRPSISYADNTNDSLKFAQIDGAAWQIEMVDGDRATGIWSSLAPDASGRPHIR